MSVFRLLATLILIEKMTSERLNHFLGFLGVWLLLGMIDITSQTLLDLAFAFFPN